MEKLVECGVATLALPGEAEAGDQWVVKQFPNGVLASALDGLGHGAEAAAAARLACTLLYSHAEEAITELLERCHHLLRGTRGAAISLASFNVTEGTLSWLGVGDVQGILLRADLEASPASESLLLRRGVVGSRLPSLSAAVVRVNAGDTLIFMTDGVRATSESLERWPSAMSPQAIADQILASRALRTDDALVLVVRFGGGGA